MKRDKCDIVFSTLVRERSDWTCEVCGKVYPEGHRAGLECSHFFGRARKATRLHPLNAAAHCTHCHFHLGGNPIEFSEWIEGHLGKEKADYLRLLANSICKKTKAYKELEYQHLKSELERIRSLRKQGVTGRIDFEPY